MTPVDTVDSFQPVIKNFLVWYGFTFIRSKELQKKRSSSVIHRQSSSIVIHPQLLFHQHPPHPQAKRKHLVQVRNSRRGNDDPLHIAHLRNSPTNRNGGVHLEASKVVHVHLPPMATFPLKDIANCLRFPPLASCSKDYLGLTKGRNEF